MKGLRSITFWLFATNLSLGQTSNSFVNLTELEKQENYYTENKLVKDKNGVGLFYVLISDDKNTSDDEIERTIYIQIPSPTMSTYSLQDLEKYYTEQGALHFKVETQKLTGTISIIELNDSNIKADLNVEFILNGKNYSCVGIQTFRND